MSPLQLAANVMLSLITCDGASGARKKNGGGEMKISEMH